MLNVDAECVKYRKQ